jgi:LmbE family N-acetylglucosaminyl deacetylase
MKPVLLAVVAHPDDETFGMGSVIASAAADGARVVVCCATRGEAGEDTSGTTDGPETLARVREGELRAAAQVLGAAGVELLDFADSGMAGDLPVNALAGVALDRVVAAVREVIDRVRPDVVVGMDFRALDDHRDHVRIGEATALAFEQSSVAASGRLYAWTLARPVMDRWLGEMKESGLLDAYVDMKLGRELDEVTTVIDVAPVIDLRRAGIAEHRTQAGPFAGLSDEVEVLVLSTDYLLRIVPAWTGGPVETSLFGEKPTLRRS